MVLRWLVVSDSISKRLARSERAKDKDKGGKPLHVSLLLVCKTILADIVGIQGQDVLKQELIRTGCVTQIGSVPDVMSDLDILSS
jgi:hypothetical protein